MTSGHGVVRWSGTDASGRFHFTEPLIWVEEVEHAYYRAADPPTDPGTFPRRQVRSTFHHPLEAGDPYRVALTTARIGHSSITYRWSISSGETHCVDGEHTVVHVGPDGRPARVPEGVRIALAPLIDRSLPDA